jgi:hypothetical protein
MKRARPEDAAAGGAPAAAAAAPPPGGARARAPFVRRAIAASVKSAVQALVLDIMFPGGAPAGRYLGERPELPGPQPVSLNRRNLATVAAQAYGVCEKSDGERAMLLLVRLPAPVRGSAPVPAGAYLVDRTFDVVTFDGADAYAALAGGGGPTLLEGELLLRRTDMGTGTGALAVFNMFDCVAAAGADVAARPLKERLDALRKAGREPYLELERGATAAAGALLPPLYLIGKVIVSKSDVRGVLEKITHFGEDSATSGSGGGGVAGAGGGAGGGGAAAAAESVALLESELAAEGAPTCHRLYRGDKTRVNATDGLILTPSDASYRDLFSSADACVSTSRAPPAVFICGAPQRQQNTYPPPTHTNTRSPPLRIADPGPSSNGNFQTKTLSTSAFNCLIWTRWPAAASSAAAAVAGRLSSSTCRLGAASKTCAPCRSPPRRRRRTWRSRTGCTSTPSSSSAPSSPRAGSGRSAACATRRRARIT